MSMVTQNLTIPTPEELNSYKLIAQVASNNPYWRKIGGNGTEESMVATILSVMLLARELGISPMVAISGGINNIQGKFEISARLMNQLIRKHGHKICIKSCTNEVCIIWSKRKDTGEEHTEKYHIEEAARAGLIKDGARGPGAWKTVPKDMLFARCISRLARRLYPDCIGGCYVEGELQESAKGEVIETIEIPTQEELDCANEIPKELISLDLPDEVNKEEVEEFVKHLSSQHDLEIDYVKKKANANISAFMEKFYHWKESLTSQEKTEALV